MSYLYAMKLIIISILISVFTLSVVAQDATLPTGARDLATKLEEWEAEQKSEYEARILQKRQQVIQALQAALENATKSGDLDGALAIRNYVEKISPPKDQPESVTPEMPARIGKLEHKWLMGEWVEEGREDGNVMVINRDGTVAHGGKGEWKINGEILEIQFFNGHQKRIDLNQNSKEKISVEAITPEGKSSMWTFLRK